MVADCEYQQLTRDELLQKLNLETGQISWQELQRYFARGVVVVLAPQQDLVAVGADLAHDNQQRIATLVDGGKLHRATDDDAKAWQAQDPRFWALVVAPWVLVQQID